MWAILVALEYSVPTPCVAACLIRHDMFAITAIMAAVRPQIMKPPKQLSQQVSEADESMRPMMQKSEKVD